MYFEYSTHKTHAKAAAALEDYFANCEISEAEAPYIARTKTGRYAVMFPGC